MRGIASHALRCRHPDNRYSEWRACGQAPSSPFAILFFQTGKGKLAAQVARVEPLRHAGSESAQAVRHPSSHNDRGNQKADRRPTVPFSRITAGRR